MAKPKSKSKTTHARKGASVSPRESRGRSWSERLRAWATSLDRALLAILVLSAILRFWGIGDRLPDVSLGINVLDDTAIEETDRTTVLRSWQMWRGGTKEPDLNPHTGGWPALSFYLTLGIQVAYKGWYGLSHPGLTANEFMEQVQGDPAPLFFVARIVNAIIGVASVALTWHLALPLVGRIGAILAALFLATNPLHILTSQHVSDPNLLALVFVAVAVASIATVAGGGGARASVIAGVAIGLAAACKYVPLVLIAPLALAHLQRREWKLFGIAAALAFVAMFVASPYTFLDWKTTTTAFVVQRRSLFSDWVGQSAFPISLPTYLIASLPKALGWPVYLLSLLGFVSLWRSGRPGRMVAVAALVIVGANGVLRTAQERYLLVAYPMLMTAAGAGAVWLVRAVLARLAASGAGAAEPGGAAKPSGAAPAGGRLTSGAFLFLAAIAAAAPMPDLVTVRDALHRPDSRHEARRWINQAIGVRRRLAVELYGPVFAENERNLVIWPFFATQARLVAPAYHVEFLDGLEMISLSGEISRRFVADSLKYPEEAFYYRWIRSHGESLWRSDGEGRKLSGPKIEVRTLPAGISTRSQRDSLFAKLQPVPNGTYRLALWCNDMALLFSRSGEHQRAEEWALRGLQVRARNMNSRLYATLAMSRLNLSNFVGAEEAARAGLAAGANSWALHLYRGMALERLGRLDEALSELRDGFARSNDPRARLNIAQVLSELGRYDEAVAELAQIPPGIPERASARRDMAVLLLNQLHRPQEGLVALREAATLEPDPSQAKLMRDEIARLEGSSR